MNFLRKKNYKPGGKIYEFIGQILKSDPILIDTSSIFTSDVSFLNSLNKSKFSATDTAKLWQNILKNKDDVGFLIKKLNKEIIAFLNKNKKLLKNEEIISKSGKLGLILLTIFLISKSTDNINVDLKIAIKTSFESYIGKVEHQSLNIALKCIFYFISDEKQKFLNATYCIFWATPTLLEFFDSNINIFENKPFENKFLEIDCLNSIQIIHIFNFFQKGAKKELMQHFINNLLASTREKSNFDSFEIEKVIPICLVYSKLILEKFMKFCIKKEFLTFLREFSREHYHSIFPYGKINSNFYHLMENNIKMPFISEFKELVSESFLVKNYQIKTKKYTKPVFWINNNYEHSNFQFISMAQILEYQTTSLMDFGAKTKNLIYKIPNKRKILFIYKILKQTLNLLETSVLEENIGNLNSLEVQEIFNLLENYYERNPFSSKSENLEVLGHKILLLIQNVANRNQKKKKFSEEKLDLSFEHYSLCNFAQALTYINVASFENKTLRIHLEDIEKILIFNEQLYLELENLLLNIKNRIGKQKSEFLPPLRIVISGGDTVLNCFISVYSFLWLKYENFFNTYVKLSVFIVPLSGNWLSNFLAKVDSLYFKHLYILCRQRWIVPPFLGLTNEEKTGAKIEYEKEAKKIPGVYYMIKSVNLSMDLLKETKKLNIFECHCFRLSSGTETKIKNKGELFYWGHQILIVKHVTDSHNRLGHANSIFSNKYSMDLTLKGVEIDITGDEISFINDKSVSCNLVELNVFPNNTDVHSVLNFDTDAIVVKVNLSQHKKNIALENAFYKRDKIVFQDVEIKSEKQGDYFDILIDQELHLQRYTKIIVKRSYDINQRRMFLPIKTSGILLN